MVIKPFRFEWVDNHDMEGMCSPARRGQSLDQLNVPARPTERKNNEIKLIGSRQASFFLVSMVISRRVSASGRSRLHCKVLVPVARLVMHEG